VRGVLSPTQGAASFLPGSEFTRDNAGELGRRLASKNRGPPTSNVCGWVVGPGGGAVEASSRVKICQKEGIWELGF